MNASARATIGVVLSLFFLTFVWIVPAVRSDAATESTFGPERHWLWTADRDHSSNYSWEFAFDLESAKTPTVPALELHLTGVEEQFGSLSVQVFEYANGHRLSTQNESTRVIGSRAQTTSEST